MATIVRDPRVADHIVELGIESDQDCAEVRRNYEAGNLVLLREARFDLDFAFLNALNFDVEGPPDLLKKLKKYSGDKIVALDSAGNNNRFDQFVYQIVFGSDAGKLAYFQEQVRSGNRQSDALYARLFPSYRTTRAMHTWRLTSTRFENLHWDNIGIPELFHQVRIFTNIASSPRLWRTSHRVDEFAQTVYTERGLEQFAGGDAEELNRHLNKSLGGMKNACLDRLPKHHIAFEQGEVWLCETRIVAHQIYHGERVFAAMYLSDPDTMDRPDLGFEARIARLHERHGSSRPNVGDLSLAH